MIATILEAWFDRNGDTNKSADVWLRVLLFVLEGALIKWAFGGNVFLAINLSAAFFFLVFDYLIHIVLYRNGVITSPAWFEYMGRSSKIDNISWWRNMNPWLKLFIRLLYLAIALFLYIKL